MTRAGRRGWSISAPDSDWIRDRLPDAGAACWARRWRALSSPWRLLASGQSSTITGTLAGQVVMEGFMHWRIRPGCAG